jgi:hypothetical protein
MFRFSWRMLIKLWFLLYIFFWVVLQRVKFYSQRFGTHCLFHLHTHSPMKIEQAECSETLAIKLHTPENNPKQNKRHSKHGRKSEMENDFCSLLSAGQCVWSEVSEERTVYINRVTEFGSGDCSDSVRC